MTGRYPLPKHKSTTFYQVGLNSDTEPNSDVLANYINDRGEKVMILVGPPHAFETPEDMSVLITKIERSIYAVVNGRAIAMEAMSKFDVDGLLRKGSDTPIGVARTNAINRALDAVYEYMGYNRPGVDWELHDKITQQIQLERQQQLAQLAEERRHQAETIGEFLSETDDGGGKPDETDQ